jgi:tRNA pseudouridine38-40 synthase
LQRYFIELSYNGTRYHGWQIQQNAHTVQAELNQMLSILLRDNIEAIGAGRTDAGVHARRYIAHFDAPKEFDAAKTIGKLNKMLSPDICIYNIFPVKPNAHARFDAISRTYKYMISPVKNPFLQELACFIHYSLDVKKMNEAANMLIGNQDFTSFAKLHTDVTNNFCNVTEAFWEKYEHNNTLVFTIRANRFLRNMVRAIVGTLIDVGRGKIAVQDFKTVIDSKDRGMASTSAPAQGLFLWDMQYPY